MLKNFVYDKVAPNLLNVIKKDFVYVENFLNKEERNEIFDLCERNFKRQEYSYSHLDNVISGYKEFLKSGPGFESIKRKVQSEIGEPITECMHFIELERDGYIDPHIDNVDSCGSIVAAINLCSDAILKFEDEENSVQVLLKENSFYITKNLLRYKYKHSILKSDLFNGKKFNRKKRISVIFRN